MMDVPQPVIVDLEGAGNSSSGEDSPKEIQVTG